MPTRIKAHAEQSNGGLLLSGIAELEDAESLRNFFREREFPATIDANGCVLLMGLPMEHFITFVERANIELI